MTVTTFTIVYDYKISPENGEDLINDYKTLTNEF